MEDKIWYEISNTRNYPKVGLIKVDDSNSFENFDNIKEAIDLFKSTLDWEDMWNLHTASIRFSQGDILYLLRDNEGALGHVWFANNYLYNLFVHPRRRQGLSEEFVKACLNNIEEPTVACYCDKWNIRAQKFFEKVGFKRISS